MEQYQDKASPEAQEQGNRLMRWASLASLATAVALISVKAVAWWYTGSVALLSSLADSFLDAFASLITFYCVRKALIPADDDHRFGHGKAEALGALAQAGIISASSIFIGLHAIDAFFSPKEVSHGDWGIAVILFSILVTLALTRFQAYVVRKSGSVAIKADALHYTSDLLMNLAVIVALVLAQFANMPLADPIIAMGIVLWLLYSASKVGRQALDMLMDKELPDDKRREIALLIRSEPDVIGFHELKTRQSGRDLFIQVHLDLDGKLSLTRAWEVGAAVEKKILDAFPQAEITIKKDPAGVQEVRFFESDDPGQAGQKDARGPLS
ncbi:cation diffusion facilitator family transporter [Rhodovibrionaceae bacterium A322]